MIRTLQLASIHGWVSLRLTVSRHYWLPRLTFALMAGYMLFSAPYFNPDGWGPVVTSFVVGFSCFALWMAELNAKNLPIPLQPSWIALVNCLVQILVCMAIAIGFIILDIVAGYVLSLSAANGDWGRFFQRPVPNLPTTSEWTSMATMLLASVPVGLVVVFFGNHFQQPTNAWPLRPWTDVFSFLAGVTACFTVALLTAYEAQAPVFVLHYIQAWLGCALFLTGIAVLIYGTAALFPASQTRTRIAKTARLRLTTTVWQSQAIKWSLLLVGLGLYLVPPTAYLPEDWPVRLGDRARPLFICYAALLPFLSMIFITSGQTTNRSRQFVGSWKWNRSAWQMIPVHRHAIQRALLLDLFGFAASSSILLHVIGYWMGHAALNNPDLSILAVELSLFTWYFTWFTGIALPTFALFVLPRRRFGLAASVVAFGSTLWTIKLPVQTALSGQHEDIGWTLGWSLTLTQHALVMGSWVLLAAVLWGQTASPTGRLFETGSPATRWLFKVGSFIAARRTRWFVGIGTVIVLLVTVTMHRAAMNTRMATFGEDQITVEQTSRLIEDLQRIEELNILTTTSRSTDAGPLLNPYIGLEDRDGTPAETVPWWDNIDHKYTLNRPDTPWFEAPHDVEIGDLSILRELLAYDHWETGRAPTDDKAPVGKYEEHIHSLGNQAYLHWASPFPNLVSIIDLAKFRLLAGLREGTVLSALSEVRHLAKLVYSDESLTNTMLAIGILRAERRAYMTALHRELLRHDEWAVVSEDDLNRMQRVAVSMDFVMSGGASEAQWRRIDALAFEPFGLCGAIHSAMTHAMSQPNIGLWPGEIFPLPNMAFIDQALDHRHCSTPLARRDHKKNQSESPFINAKALFRNKDWHQTLVRDVDESRLRRLSIPYLRSQAWLDIQNSQNMLGFLMYGDTAEEDWNGAKSRK